MTSKTANTTNTASFKRVATSAKTLYREVIINAPGRSRGYWEGPPTY
ncbi:MAG: hypothetical protein AAF563_17165 [Pseudomonadota bacterium]